MKTNGVLKWYLIGIAATGLFVFLGSLAFSPSIGRAQEGGEDEANNLIWALGEPGQGTQQTDNPTGQAQVPLGAAGEMAPNDQGAVAEAGPSTGRTDDPLGRTVIALAEEAALPANDLARSDNDPDKGVFDPVRDQTNRAREAALQSSIGGQFTSPLVIPAADFGPDGANPDSMFFPFGGGYFTGDAQNYGCMVAPAYLPNGVTVTDLFVSTYDNDGTFNFSVSLRRVDNFAGGTNTMASAATSGTFAGVQVVSDASIDNPVILYPDYSYYVTACVLSGNIRIYSARIYYTEP